MRTVVAWILAALVLLGGLAAADSGVTTLNPGERTDVVTMSLRAGQTVDYAWSSGGSTEFRIERGGTEVFTTTGQVGQGTYTVLSDGTYTFSFRNRGTTLNIVSWNITRPADTGSLLLIVLGILAIVVVVIVVIALLARRGKTGPSPPPPPPPPPPR